MDVLNLLGFAFQWVVLLVTGALARTAPNPRLGMC